MEEGAVKRKKCFPEGSREASLPLENRIRRTSGSMEKEKIPASTFQDRRGAQK